ncbi:MAG: ParB N-terminal domain-containing protein [Gemmatimonadaceae bacterium]|nr:ParB N-terminal domain-containing protein [Gemmatimonadaceae bacterium]
MTRVEMVETERITLDKENPRIKHFMEIHDEITEAGMRLALGAGGDSEDEVTAQDKYRQLRRAIKETGGVVQPIILKEQGEGSYLCVEGNTRVAIYRELAREDTQGGWEKILAIVHDEMDEQRAHEIRLQVHLVGPRSWPAYAKAKYLSELWEQDQMPMAEIIRVCGGTQQQVEREIKAYGDMERFYRPVAEADGFEMFDYSRFSAFRELQNVKEGLYGADKDERHFAQWIHAGLFQPQNTVRALPEILADAEATKVFLKEGAKEAIKHLDAGQQESESDSPVRDATIEELATALRRRINRLSFDESQEIATSPGSPVMVELDAVRESIDTLVATTSTDEE